MVEHILPAVAKRYAGPIANGHKMVLQVDNATPHKSTYEKLVKLAIETFGITLINQPAQSPDFNANDLAFYNSFQCAVNSLSVNARQDREEVWEACKRVWAEFPSSKMVMIWEILNVVLMASIEVKGGNGFVIPHVGLRAELKEYTKELQATLDTVENVDDVDIVTGSICLCIMHHVLCSMPYVICT